MAEQTVLDMCCGSRMFWFNKHDTRAVFTDIRSEEHELCDGRRLVIRPDLIADFRALPFADNTFPVVVFDPSHLERVGEAAWMGKKYGRLNKATWRADLRAGFEEAFRVLRPHGVLIFKWNETQIPVSQILALTDVKPIIGQRTGKNDKTHWISFVKDGEPQNNFDPQLQYATKRIIELESLLLAEVPETQGLSRRTTSAACSITSIGCGWNECRYRQLSLLPVRWPLPWRNTRERDYR